MIRPSKWDAGLHPERPLTEVAREALRGRLETVGHYLKLAAKDGQADIEAVHQLRVSTRRARAAIEVFQDLLPKRRAKRMNRRLRKLRQAAGTARDLDVLCQRLRKLANQGGGSLDAIVRQVDARQQAARKPLAASCNELKRKRFKRRSRKLVKAVRLPNARPVPTLGEAGKQRLTPLLDKLFEAATQDLSDLKALHRLRLSGKQVRYAVELLGGAFKKSLREELYKSIEELQERLGLINDHATAIGMFTELRNRTDCGDTRAELAGLIESEEEMLAAKRHDFEAWWTPERVTEMSQRFTSALASQPGS